MTPHERTLLNHDATTLAHMIRQGVVTSEEVVTIYINHIKHTHSSLNALVEERFEEAIAEARRCDQAELSDAEKGPLFGVPISIKESFNVSGLPTTGGLIHLKGATSLVDAPIVHDLKEAGAIIVGKTNTPSLCFCQETDNKLYGRTNNPWDLTRTAGGSSGGEGALLAVGGAALGYGSDIGGSIRFPAHFNGVIGFKAGYNQINNDGHFPSEIIPLQQRMSGIGPMGKSVRDIQLAYNLTAKEMPETRDFDHAHIAILKHHPEFPLSKITQNILDDLEHFLKQTHHTTRETPQRFETSAELWQEIMSIDGGKEKTELAFNTSRPPVIRTYLEEILTGRTTTHAYLSWALIAAGLFKPSKKRLKEIEDILSDGDNILQDDLENKLLIFPIYHSGAQQHGRIYSEIFSIRKTFRRYLPFIAYANVWGLPALTIPVTTDEAGMPISIQIMSKNGNEDLIFKLGDYLSQSFRGYVRCEALDNLTPSN